MLLQIWLRFTERTIEYITRLPGNVVIRGLPKLCTVFPIFRQLTPAIKRVP